MHNKLVIELGSKNNLRDIEYSDNATSCYPYNDYSNNIVIDLKGLVRSQLVNLSRTLHDRGGDITRLTLNNTDSYRLNQLAKIIKELISNKNNAVIFLNDEKYVGEIDQLILNIKNKEIQLAINRLKVSIDSIKYQKYMKLFEIKKNEILNVHCDHISNSEKITLLKKRYAKKLE